ncbi:MAG: ABC transporter permease [Candidatus Binatia bacterium]
MKASRNHEIEFRGGIRGQLSSLVRVIPRGKYLKIAVGGLILSCLVLTGLLSPIIVPHSPLKQTLELRLKPPAWHEGGDWNYPLGTDFLGRDIFSRILYGSRISLLIGTTTVLLAGLVGCLLGAISGYFGLYIDELIQRLVEIFLAFPFLLLAIALMAFLGTGVGNMILALVLSRWVQYCRVVRGEVLSLKERDFVIAARALGQSHAKIVLRHILPNTLPSILIVATFAMATVIITEASLSFLGVGVPPSIPTWGSMLSEGRSYIHRAPWLAMFPGLAIFVTVLGINLLGDGLRDIFDPRLRGEH